MFDKDNKFGFIINNNESNNNVEGLDKVKTDINNIKSEVNELNTQYKDIANNKADKNSIFTMANMGQDIKEAMTGGSVAVVGKNTILTENIVNGQITPEKTSFLNIVDDPNYVAQNLINTITWSEKGYVRDSSGNLADSSVNSNNKNYICSDLIKIPRNTTLRLTTDYTLLNYILYDSNRANGVQTSISFKSGEFDINVGEHEYIALNVNQQDGQNYNIPTSLCRITQLDTDKIIEIPKLKFTQENIDDMKYELKPLLKPLKDKIIVNFGDSIFGNTDGDTSISNVISNVTGATVYNCAFGGCRMSSHPSEGYKEFSMYKLADAITTGDFSSQETGATVSGVPKYFTSHVESLKSIDFNKVDYITIAYGTNDWTGGVPIDKSDETNNYFFKDALQYSLQKIITKYPHIQILLISAHFRFWNSNIETNTDTKVVNDDYKVAHHLYDFNNCIEEVAKEFKVPYLNNYDELGINKYNCTYYIPLEDGAHHNEKGRKLIGQRVSNKLISM